jgi:hypothetical protein
MLVIDLKSDAAVKSIDMRPIGAGVTDLAFVSDEAILLSTEWIGLSTEAYLLDWRSERMAAICSDAFGEADGAKGNPRALAVNTKFNLVAVSMRDEVRVFRYRLVSRGNWSVERPCSTPVLQ